MIEVDSLNILRNQYTLRYTNGGIFSLVEKIEESFGAISLPAINFEWSKISNKIPKSNYKKSFVKQMVEQPNFYHIGFMAADVDGDGKSDIISLFNPNSSSINEGKSKACVYVENEEGEYTLYNTYTLCNNLSPLNGTYQTQNCIGDFSGIGKDELMIPVVSGNGKLQVYSPQKGGLYFNIKSTEVPAYTIGTLYNNGKANFVFVDKALSTTSSETGYRAVFIYRNKDDIQKYCETYLDVPSQPRRIFLADYNGNGMQDLLVLHDKGYTIFWHTGASEGKVPYANSKKIAMTNFCNASVVEKGDFNGDGKIDFLTNNTDDDNWYFFLNNGNGSFTKSIACTIGAHYHSFTNKDNEKLACCVYDYNNDGKDDVVITKAHYNKKIDKVLGVKVSSVYGEFSKTYTYWLKSDGKKLENEEIYAIGNDNCAKRGFYIVGDFNGDGFADMANYGYNCSYSSYVREEFYTYTKHDLNSNKLKKISIDKNGDEISITYTTLCNKSVYTKGSESKYPLVDIQIPLSVVKSIRQYDVTGNWNIEYEYTGLRAHLQGRGLIGFTSVVATNKNTKEKRTTTVNLLNNKFFEPQEITTTITRGNKTSTTITTMETKVFAGMIRFSYPKIEKQTDFYGNVATTTKTYTNYRLTKERIEYGSSSMYKQVEYSSFANVGGTQKPQTITITQKHKDDNSAFSQKITLAYNTTTGDVTQMVENANNKPITHSYTYDSYGNTLTHTISGSGVPTTTSTKTYDATHRFLVQEKSTANQLIKKYNYNSLGRLVSKQEGISGSLLTTSYQYDAIGNLIKTTYPDGTTTTIERGWGNSKNKRYYQKTLQIGSAPVTTWFNSKNKTVKTTTSGEKNISVVDTISYEYNTGLVYKVGKIVGNIEQKNSFSYNNLGQITKAVYNDNKTVKYSYSKNAVSSTYENVTKSQAFDLWGNLVCVQENSANNVYYKYSSNGQPKSIEYSSADRDSYQIASMSYNSAGQQTSLTDVDAGKTTYEYDALGRIIKQTDARGNVTTKTYNASGLVTSMTCGGVTTNYTYDEKLRLVKEIVGKQLISYEYDKYNRLTKKVYSIDGEVLNFRYVYNSIGQLTAKTFPDGMTENYIYDDNGNLLQVTMGTERVWELASFDGVERTANLGPKQLVLYKGYSEESKLLNSSIKNGNTILHSFNYEFNEKTGELTKRIGMNGTEKFTYDQFCRLTKTNVNGIDNAISYRLNGNISQKSDIGTYTYDDTRKNAVVQVTDPNKLLQGTQAVTYNAFNKVETVKQGTYSLAIIYGPTRQRCKTILVNGSTTTTTLYADNYEQRTINGVTTSYHYVSSPDGLIAVYVKQGNTITPYYIEKDHLGSIVNIYDANGTQHFSATYDVWGKQTITKNTIGITRGYTGHEHWNQFGLIDMNGRFYDPQIARFLSPDPYVQDPSVVQNYNRYSYCMNNPLKYTDPSGRIWEPEPRPSERYKSKSPMYKYDREEINGFLTQNDVNNFIKSSFNDNSISASTLLCPVNVYYGDEKSYDAAARNIANQIWGNNSSYGNKNGSYNGSKSQKNHTASYNNSGGGNIGQFGATVGSNMANLTGTAANMALIEGAQDMLLPKPNRIKSGYSAVSKIGTGASIVGAIFSGINSTLEYYNGTFNTHSIVDIGVAATSIVAMIAASTYGLPALAVGATIFGTVYGLASVCGLSTYIDKISDDCINKKLFGYDNH